jgi:hypothetical protein
VVRGGLAHDPALHGYSALTVAWPLASRARRSSKRILRCRCHSSRRSSPMAMRRIALKPDAGRPLAGALSLTPERSRVSHASSSSGQGAGIQGSAPCDRDRGVAARAPVRAAGGPRLAAGLALSVPRPRWPGRRAREASSAGSVGGAALGRGPARSANGRHRLACGRASAWAPVGRGEGRSLKDRASIAGARWQRRPAASV